jgi:excisionase family DNA binding protein
MDSDSSTGMFSVEEAARFLGVSSHSVRRLAQSGELQSVRYLNRLMFRHEALDEFVDRHTVEAA